jgi:hypothetical protein
MLNNPPTGRINSKRRPFEDVVADIRHAVYAVMQRKTDTQTGLQQIASIGSGFFASSKVFVTCYHVIMNSISPHQDGIQYDLVNNLGPGKASVHTVSNAVTGQNLHLFPEDDLAILIVDGNQSRAYVSLEYGEIRVGAEIGIAGYPIPRLGLVNGKISCDGLLFRVAKSVLTSTYNTTINTDTGNVLVNVPVMEVNFLFVPGNSGGPIFSADTGRVLGFVHGFQSYKILERVETVTLVKNLPAGMGNTYMHNQTALYSLGIVLSRVRPHLEKFGVSL